MKVLIGVDGSEHGYAAVAMVGLLLDPDRDQVAFVCSPPKLNLKRASDVQSAIRDRAREALLQGIFDEAVARTPLGLRGNAARIALDDAPADAILSAADKEQADLIAVGARGLGKLKSLLLGSVSRAVVHGAKVPTLVVRGWSPTDAADALKILVASEPAGCMPAVEELLGKLHWPPGAEGRIVTVIESMLAGDIPPWLAAQIQSAETQQLTKAWDEEHAAARRQAEEAMRELRRRLPAAFQASEPMVCEGPAGDRIVETAEGEQVDLIVIGAHRRGRVERLLVGGAGQRVLDNAPCSVLVVRES